MLHGNILLSGWRLSDVSFYATELPEYMVVAAVRGLRPDVVQICAAITYTLCTLLVALVAKGRATGREGAARAACRRDSTGTAGGDQRTLLTNPDHTGTAVPILLLLLMLGGTSLRNRMPVIAFVVLSAGVLSDQITLSSRVAPLLAVWLSRAGQGAWFQAAALNAVSPWLPAPPPGRMGRHPGHQGGRRLAHGSDSRDVRWFPGPGEEFPGGMPGPAHAVRRQVHEPPGWHTVFAFSA